jgi:3-dehydroquinate synthase
LRLVRVELGERSYNVVAGEKIFSLCAQFLQEGNYSGKALIVTDQTVDRLYADSFAEALRPSGIALSKITVPVGEEAKSLKWAEKIYDQAVGERLDRRSPFIALGGGVAGDLAGFAAATYLRGVPFLQVPTTLLAQVDASVGGKVAVNHPAAKNMIGAFHQPDAVFADTGVLKTLPERDYASGLSEVVKTACLAGEGLLDFLMDRRGLIAARDLKTLEEVVGRSCQYKARIGAGAEREGGRRAFLNLGHTFAHAIEAEGGFRLYTHGEAVAVGLLGALALSEEFAGLEKSVKQKVSALLSAFGLPLAAEVDLEKTFAALWHDKKALNGKLRWVLLGAPGEPLVKDGLPPAAAHRALSALVKGGPCQDEPV